MWNCHYFYELNKLCPGKKILLTSGILYLLLNKQYEKNEIDNSCIGVSDNAATGTKKENF